MFGLGAAKLSSKVVSHFAFPPAMNESPVALHPCQHLMLSGFCILVILKGVEHFFIYSYAICVFSLVYYLLRSLAYFLIKCLFSC
jgi:hypothetical protein